VKCFGTVYSNEPTVLGLSFAAIRIRNKSIAEKRESGNKLLTTNGVFVKE
jgi:hypothetical protein